jgi:hypothetical protein
MNHLGLLLLRHLAVLLALAISPGASGQDCDLIPTFADGKRPLREVFVSPTGSDSTGDGSVPHPFRTLTKAAVGVRPGDALRLLPGTHAPGTSLADLRGNADAPIWIGGVPGQPRPVIAGGSQALHLSRVRYLVVEQFEVRGAAQNGVNCDDGGERANPDATRHVIFRQLRFHDIGSGGNQDALKLSGVNGFFVLDCEFARTSAGGSGIDMVGCQQGVVARCRFSDMGSNAIQCKGGTAELDIRQNRFINAGQRAVNLGGSTGFEFFRPPLAPAQPNVEARDLRVTANVFRGSDAPVAFVGAVNCLVANNTIIEPRRWVLRILQETTSRDGFTFAACASNQFVNNLVVFRRAQLSTFVNTGAHTAPGTFVFAHNLWFAADDPARSTPTLPVAETGGVVPRDPRWRGAAAGDGTLATNSPARHAGRPLPQVKADLHGNCFATPPSIGAIEGAPPVAR